MEAAEWTKNPEVIILLLDAGADGKAKDNDGNTAFDYAMKNKHIKRTDAYRRLNVAQY